MKVRRSVCVAFAPPLSVVVNIGGVKFEVEFSPIVLFGEIAYTKVDPVSQRLPDVLVVCNNFLNQSIGTPDDGSQIGTWGTNHTLRSNSANFITNIDLVPIDVSGKTLSPVPPNCFRRPIPESKAPPGSSRMMFPVSDLGFRRSLAEHYRSGRCEDR